MAPNLNKLIAKFCRRLEPIWNKIWIKIFKYNLTIERKKDYFFIDMQNIKFWNNNDDDDYMAR